jgi:hypothetical protein
LSEQETMDWYSYNWMEDGMLERKESEHTNALTTVLYRLWGNADGVIASDSARFAKLGALQRPKWCSLKTDVSKRHLVASGNSELPHAVGSWPTCSLSEHPIASLYLKNADYRLRDANCNGEWLLHVRYKTKCTQGSSGSRRNYVYCLICLGKIENNLDHHRFQLFLEFHIQQTGNTTVTQRVIIQGTPRPARVAFASSDCALSSAYRCHSGR